jgi:hypothetical protein
VSETANWISSATGSTSKSTRPPLLRVRGGDIATGDLVPLDRAAPNVRSGLVRAFLAGEPSFVPTLTVCAEAPERK